MSNESHIPDLNNSNEIPKTLVPYVNFTEIFISNRTLEFNNKTWTHSGVYQQNTVEFFNKEIASNPSAIVLDIGAQSGAFSLLAKYHPNMKWYCFECDPTNYELLQENLKLNNITNCSTLQLAVSSQTGMNTLRRSTHFGLHTLGSKPRRFAEDASRNIEVRTISIDEVVNLLKLPSIDFIKIDTEGSELNILKGAVKSIEKFHPKILLEYYGDNLAQFDQSTDELMEFINKELSYEQVNQLEDNIYIRGR